MRNNIRQIPIGEIVKSVSDTHAFKQSKLYAVNTSDVENGYFLAPRETPVKELKGQFKKTFQKGDILFSEIRPINRHFALVNFDDTDSYVASTKLMVLRKYNDDVDLDYFYYYITSTQFLNILQKRAENRIGSFPQITFDLVCEYSIPVPDMSIQKAISQTLKSLDRQMEINSAIAEMLTDLLKTTYDYWFTQFDFPNENGEPYRKNGGEMVYNDELDQDIPIEWKVVSVESLLSKVPKTKKYQSSEFAKRGRYPIIDQGEEYICGYTDKEEDLIKEEDAIVFGDHSKRLKYVNFPFARGADGTQIIISNNKQLPNTLLYMQLQEKPLYGPSYARHFKMLKQQMVFVPDEHTSAAFTAIATLCWDQINEMTLENYQLKELRDYLLPLLMSGQVVVNVENEED